MSLHGNLKYYLAQLKGQRTKSKLVVFESDDWGAERISDKVKLNLLRKLPGFKDGPHSRVDTMEGPEDYDELLETLKSIETQIGKKVKLTLNFLSGNPDYNRIKEGNFGNYYFEPFTESYEKKYGSNACFNLLKEGIDLGYFQVQFHGREHVWVKPWMEQLQNENSIFRKAFDLNNFGADFDFSSFGINYQEAWNIRNASDIADLEQSIVDGLFYFKKTFGFLPITAVAPRHVWGNDTEQALLKSGIIGIQSSAYRLKTKHEGGGREPLYTGQKGDIVEKILCRNAWFETSYSEQNWVNEVLRKAKLAFFLGNPLIICSHRLNFVGGLLETNRKKTLKQLKELVFAINNSWPDVEFISSDELLMKLKIE